MKTRSRSSQHPKTRPVLALLVFVATLFLLAGRACGVVGALLSASVARLLGDAGTGLLIGTLWCVAFILATPPGTFTRIVVALWRACTVRQRPSVVVLRQRPPAMPEMPERPALVSMDDRVLRPRDRQTLDAVRSALKNLDFNKNEYEPLVARMDASLGFEKLVKNALASLREVN